MNPPSVARDAHEIPAAKVGSVGIVVIFGDRDPQLPLNLLRTLAAQTRLPEAVVLVNFGSPCPEFEQVSMPCPFIYRHLPQGLPWSLPLAKNQGVALLPPVESVLFLDSDVLLAPDFLERGLARLGPGTMINCRVLDLPQHAITPETDVARDYERLRALGTWRREVTAVGVCQWLRTPAFRKLRGHDEAYKMWCFADMDFQRRARWIGLHPIHLDEETTMLHQWHVSKDDVMLTPNQIKAAQARRWYPRNRARIRMRAVMWDLAKYDPGEVNPDGWGKLPGEK